MGKEALDLGTILGKAKNRIYRVGVEFEGGWRKLPKGVRLIRDGSIHMDLPQDLRNIPPGMPGRDFSIGELPSQILTMDEVEEWMKINYPSDVNDTCGLHVHMSFRSARHYMRLMEESYQATVVKYLETWAKKERIPDSHTLWGRLQGRNQFCQLAFNPDVQATSKSKNYNRDYPGHRYTAINYCYSLHGTVECRVLPMLEEPKKGIAAVKQVFDITNAYLSKRGEREAREQAQVRDAGEDILEIMDIQV